MTARRAAVAAVLAAVFAVGGPLATATSAADAQAPVQRVLLISLPAVTWADLASGNAPHLDALLSQSAVADLVTRAAGRRSSPASGYATLGAGGRASAVNPLAGQAFELTEPYGATSARDAFRQRTGHSVNQGLVHLGIDALDQENEAGVYAPTLGAFGDALASAHVGRAVIANADGAQPVIDDDIGEFQRSAVNALMDSNGVVPSGRVGDELLVRDPAAPFGVRLNADAVYAAFRNAWRARSVVLVEGSDLLRADLYGEFTTPDQLHDLRLRALRDTDALVGHLLANVDFSRDAVMVVAPSSSRRGSGLTVAALRAPGVSTGLMRSATSGRSGFVYVADIAPTVLNLYGIATPTDMEGRVMQVRSQSTSAAERQAFLVHANIDGVFRDNLVNTANTTLLAFVALLAAATVLVVIRRGRGAAIVRYGALAVLGFLDATYLASALHFGRNGGDAGYWAFVVVGAAIIAFVCLVVGRGRPLGPIVVALAIIVVLHVGDLLTGAHIELNSVFGYSATVGIRTSGEGNLTFAQLTAAALLLGGILMWRRPSRRTVWLVIGMLSVTLVVMAAPPWGSDFGAALAAAPGFALFAWLALGRRVRAGTVALLGVVLVASGLLVGIIDMLRPTSQQTHIGRFFDRVTRDGFSGFAVVIRRKATENFAAFTSTRLVWLLPIGVALLAYLWWQRSSGVRKLLRAEPAVRHALVAFGVTAVLGFALNDSGIAIPALMVAVLECTAAFVVVSRLEPPAEEPAVVPRDDYVSSAERA